MYIAGRLPRQERTGHHRLTPPRSARKTRFSGGARPRLGLDGTPQLRGERVRVAGTTELPAEEAVEPAGRRRPRVSSHSAIAVPARPPNMVRHGDKAVTANGKIAEPAAAPRDRPHDAGHDPGCMPGRYWLPVPNTHTHRSVTVASFVVPTARRREHGQDN